MALCAKRSARPSEHVANVLLDPIATGIYAGDISKLSVRSCFKILWEAEQRHGSVVKGLLAAPKAPSTLLDGSEPSEWSRKASTALAVSFRDGMETLPETLEKRLQVSSGHCVANNPKLDLKRHWRSRCEKSLGVAIELGAEVKSIERRQGENDKRAMAVRYAHRGEEHVMDADFVVSTLSAKALSSVMPNGAPNELTSALDSISFSSVGLVNLVYDDPVLPYSGKLLHDLCGP